MLTTTKIPLGYIIKSTWLDMLMVFFVSVMMYEIYSVIDLTNIPVSITALIGTSISLVLAFKLGQSYDRWWEARKVWGSIVNDSRSLIIQVKNFTQSKDLMLLEKIAFRQIGWCYSFGQSLRGFSPFDNLEGLLSKEELEEIKKHENVGLALLDRHAGDLVKLKQAGLISDFQYMQIDQTIVRLCTSMGQAERIKKTVFPTAYRLFLHFFIYIFVVMLSNTLAETDGIYEIPILMMIISPFFLLEKTAYFLQDPFENRPTDIAVTSIARSIEVNIRQLINKGNNTSVEANDSSYYVM